MSINFIESPSNVHFKNLKELLASRGIKEHGQFLVFGEKLVLETLEQNPEMIIEVIESDHPDSIINPQVESLLLHHRIKVTRLHSKLFKEIDIFGINKPMLVCKPPVLKEWTTDGTATGLEVLVPVGDPSNLGAVLRSALAFSADKIVLLQEAAHVCHPKTIRATATNIFKLPLYRGPSVKQLVENSAELWALDKSGEPISRFKWPKNIRLLVGEEGPGLPAHSFEGRRLSIPINSKVESLNASVAVSIALFSYRSSSH